MYQVILCNCPSQAIAEQIARTLVSEKLAACVNIKPGITSIYQWQGAIETETEVQLMIKSKQQLFNVLSDRICSLHPYDVPEIIALEIKNGNGDYLNWIEDNLTS